MSQFYASANASGGGTGGVNSPFTLAEMIAYINASFVAGDMAWLKADGIYTISPYTLSKVGTVNAMCHMEGYSNTPTDNGMVTIQRTGGGAVIFATHTSANYWFFKNITWDGNNLGTNCVGSGGSHIYWNCVFKKAGSGGIAGGGNLVNCRCEYNAAYGAASMYAINSAFVNNGTNGFVGFFATNCVMANNGQYGIDLNVNNMSVSNCIVYNNTLGGIKVEVASVNIMNCIIANHSSGYGINYTITGETYAFNCNFYGNANDCNIPANLVNKYNINPQFTDPNNFDFRPTVDSLATIGLSPVGGLSYNYEVGVGIQPRRTGGIALPAFSGISSLVQYNNGGIRASWDLGTGTILRYNIYIKPDNSDNLFTSTYKKKSVTQDISSVGIYSEADNLTPLSSYKTYYVGIRAENNYGEETNTTILSLRPIIDWQTVIENKIDAVKTDTENILTFLNTLIANIWSYSSRALSSFGSLVSDIWSNVSRTLSDKTGFSLTSAYDAAKISASQSSVDNLPQNVWNYSTRTITSGGVSVSDIWSYANRSLTDKSGFGLNSDYEAAKTASSQNSVNAVGSIVSNIPTNPLRENDSRIDNINTRTERIDEMTCGDWEVTSQQMIFKKGDHTTEINRYNLSFNPDETQPYKRTKV